MRMKMSRNCIFLSLLTLVLCCSNASGAEHTIRSPNGNVTVRLVCEDARLSYSLSWNDREIFQNSALSLVPNAEYSVMGAETSSINTSWETVWGQFSSVQDRCEQMVLKVDVSGIQADLICRVYNDGVGFRFVVPQQQITANKPVNFVCGYHSDEPFKGWFPNGENEPIGPVPFGKRGSRKMPAVIDAGRGVFLGLLESDLYTAKEFKTAVLSGARSESRATLTRKGMTTPWRVILLGTQPGALLTSTVPLNLAAECKLEDTSWIKTGKSLWDWRVHGYQAGGFTYGINTDSYMRFIDFAAQNKIRYFLIDDSWFKKVENGKLVIKPEVDLKKIMDYAKGKGVDIILYYDRHKGKSLGDNELFKLYSELGASGIKYGFMGDNAQFTRRAVEETAANRLIVDFHDNPCPMTGISRTLPNAVTREFCHCQQDCRKAFTPTAFLKMSMINALSGPVDQNNGAYGLDGINNGERQKGPLKKNSYNSTVVSETARTLVISSGLIILPDAPEEYEKKADLFEFIRQMPATCDESQVVHSKIGEHITTARRSGDQWFVGSVINEQGGVLRIPLDFLEKGKTYSVTFYEDAPDTHYIKNRESYRIRKGHVSSTDIVEAKMAAGGGHCMWIRPANQEISAARNVSPLKADRMGERKPNIVFILVDDLGWADVGYQGKKFRTPNIDGLAKQGMVFTDAYAASPVCSPTRASIVTGKHPARLKLTSHIPSLGETWNYGRPQGNRAFSIESGIKTRNWLPESEVSIAEALKPLGYASGFFGKWHLGHESYHPVKQGFDEQTGVTNWGQPPSYYAPYRRKWKDGEIVIDDLRRGAKKGEYLTDRLTEEACSFISKQKGNKPFFCYLSYYTVHTPLQPRSDLASKGKYGGMVAALDESVGRILAHLKQEQLDNNTVVVLMSDNGGLFDNAPLRSKKGSTYEGGIREPLIVKWPGVTESGSTCSVPVVSTDFFPTFVQIAGGDPGKTTAVDGQSLVPLLKGASSLKPRALYWHFPHRKPLGNSGAIRKGQFKLIENFTTGEVELYDLSEDIGEKTDLSKQMPDKAGELLTELIAWRKELNATLPMNYDD